MAAGIGSFGAEALLRLIQRRFQRRTGHAALHGDGLISLVERNNLVEILPHIERNAALYRLNAPGDTASPAVDIKRYFLFAAISDDLFHLFRFGRIDDNVRQAVDTALAQTGGVVAGLAVGHRKPRIVLRGNIFCSRDADKGLQVLFRQMAGRV